MNFLKIFFKKLTIYLDIKFWSYYFFGHLKYLQIHKWVYVFLFYHTQYLEKKEFKYGVKRLWKSPSFLLKTKTGLVVFFFLHCFARFIDICVIVLLFSFLELFKYY